MKGLKDQARRGFTILVAVMLLTVVVVPAFSGSAVAQTSDGTDQNYCSDSETFITQLVGNFCKWQSDADTVNDSADRDAAYVQSDHHAELRGEYETANQFRTVFDNYAQDTGTIASLEARNAIASAYQNGQSASTADTKAQQAIQDYYAKKEINTLEAFSKQQAQLAYSANSTINHPDTLNNFIYTQASNPVSDGATGASTIIENRLTGNLVTHNYTLANGTTYQYKSAEYHYHVHYDSSSYEWTGKVAPKIQDFQGTNTATYSWGTDSVDHNGLNNVRAAYAGTNLSISNGHPAQVIMDMNSWASTMTMWQTQSNTIESNYQAGTASDLYQSMDTGALDPADVRGAEGQVRYLSGDSNVTTQRYKAALFGTLDMQQAGFNSTFTVEYTGYTEAHYNRTTDGTRTVEYSGYVENKTLEGMVFSSEVPAGGFEKGSTYNTENLNGTTMIYTQNNGTVTFAKGNVTFVQITDAEGNQVKNVTWSDPKYDTNDVSEYIDYLNKTQQMQLQLLEKFSDDTSSGSTSSDTSNGWNPTQNQMIAAFIAIVAMLGMGHRGAE